MVDIVGDSAHDVITQTIDFVLDHGEERGVWGGTMPDSDHTTGDFERPMIEYTDGFSYQLTNPRKRWSEIAYHWPGSTLRESEDDLFAQNPGMIPEYMDLYKTWLESTPNGDVFPHTYGQRMQQYGFNPYNSDMNMSVVIDQFQAIKSTLEKTPSTRKACMTFWDPYIDSHKMKDDENAFVPCNVFFQLRVVDGSLNWHTFCRSKDVLRGCTKNLFEFPLLQEIMAHELDVDVGTYTAQMSNVHLYKEQIDEGLHALERDDPYDYFDPIHIDSNPWEFESVMTNIDDMLIERNFSAAIAYLVEISSVYWKSWKATLIAEWMRMNKGDIDNIVHAFELIENEFQLPVAKRLYRDFDGVERLSHGFETPVARWEGPQ